MDQSYPTTPSEANPAGPGTPETRTEPYPWELPPGPYLAPHHREALQARGIDDQTIAAAKLYTGNGEIQRLLGWLPAGWNGWGVGLVIPFHRADGSEAGYHRVRPDHPRCEGKGGPIKYESPLRRSNELYFPPGFDSAAPVVIIAEGEFKALALASHGFTAIGLVGVYGWVATGPKDKKGKRIGPKRLHPDLEKLATPGRRFVVVFDSDSRTKREVRTARRDLARLLVGKGAETAIVELPDLEDGAKCGADDFIVAHGADELRELIEAAVPLTKDELAGDEVILSNSAYVEDEKAAVGLLAIADTLRTITGNWPRRQDSCLFVDDAGQIRWIEDPDDLFATLQTRGAIRWAKGVDGRGVNFITRAELFSHVRATARNYECVTAFPYEPARSDTYTTWRSPEHYDPDGRYMAELLDRFRPATEVDASLIRAFLLTLLWGGSPGQRPLFVIAPSECGRQELGKTILATMLGHVVGGAFEIRELAFGDDLPKQLVSPVALNHRLILLDNSTGLLRSPSIANLVTAQYICGRAAYGRQQRRLNLVTLAITTNDLSLSTDLASRSAVIRLDPPDRDASPTWERDVFAFIDAHRQYIVADAIAALRGTKYPITARRTRFASWCQDVLATDPAVDEILPRLQEGVRLADADADEIEVFLSEIWNRIGQGTLQANANFSPKQLAEVWNESNRDRLATGWVIRRLKAARARGSLDSLRPVSDRHGCDWCLCRAAETGGE